MLAARGALTRARAVQTANRVNLAERDVLLAEMRDANERLVLATLRADAATDDAVAARTAADGLAALELGRITANDRAKDEFLAMLGHELRNPLAPIQSALDLIAARDPGAFVRERSIIDRQVKHLVRLVDDLLDVSRITGGKIVLACRPVELATVVARALELVSPLVDEKRHVVRVTIADGLIVDVDPTRIVQAIGNLIANAAKYTPAEGAIWISGERIGSEVHLRIRDTGIGISAEMLPRVFELFAQAPQTIDRARGGLGLGLAIVRSLVGLHGGTVSCTSAGLGLGSELVVALPASGAAQATTALTALAWPQVAERKILLVDDSEDIAELMAAVLASLGHDVRVAFDGPSALAVLAGFEADVALLDIGLPGMDGYELAARLRALRPTAPLKLVAVTGYGQPADRARSTAAGFDAHLVKPVSVEALEATITRLYAEPLAASRGHA